MNLEIEYIIRSGAVKSFFDTPCSLFYHKNNKKIVVTIDDSKKLKYRIKHWNISDCKANCVLPPMEEFYTSDPFEDSNVVLDSYNLLEFNEFSPPPYWRIIYQESESPKLSSELHNKVKELWLWNSFVKIYNDTLFTLFRAASVYNKNEHSAMINQQIIFRENEQKTWKYWVHWKKHMLNLNDSPGELIFRKIGKAE